MIDVYGGDGKIDWAAVRAAGHSGAICKASEGSTLSDARLSQNLAGMKAAGLVRGAYHFFRVGQSPQVQAECFLHAMEHAGYEFDSDLPPALDLEDSQASKYGKAIVVAHVAAFLKVVEAETKRLCILYTGKYWAEDFLGDAFAGHPLWLAQYSLQPQPVLPHGWSRYAIWQWSETGTVPGVPNAAQTDLNRFAGTEADLRAWAATGTLKVSK